MKRIQRKRTKGWKMPENTVYVGRPTKWGNPFIIVKLHDGYWSVKTSYEDLFNTVIQICRPAYKTKLEAVNDAIKCYKVLVKEKGNFYFPLEEIKGKNLACFCSLSEPCHVDVLLELCT